MSSSIFELPGERLRIAFFGTPELARTILESVLEADDDDVVLVVCQPDRKAGRGKRLSAPPVKTLAVERGIEVVQPKKMKDGTLTALLEAREIDIALVAAFGRIVQPDTLAAPRFGFLNVHASLLPKYRGASPIQHAILHGDSETGVDLMVMTAGLDEGPVLHEAVMPIEPQETSASLTGKLASLGGGMLVEGLRRAKSEGLEIAPQDDAKATFAPLIAKAQGALEFSESAISLERRVRAFDPWPGTFVPVGDGNLRVLAAEADGTNTEHSPGTITGLGDALVIQTGEGQLRILEVQPPGRRGMPAKDFLRGSGRNLQIGQSLL